MPVLTTAAEVPTAVIGVAPAPPIFNNRDDVVVIGQQSKKKNGQQLIGLSSLEDCGEVECRQLIQPCGYCNVVFGNIISGEPVMIPTYENDFNSFLINFQALLNASVIIRLQKLVGSTWTNQDILNNNDYGTYYNLGSIAGHNTYTGYLLNWALVLDSFGVGIYRVLFTLSQSGSVSNLCSEQFNLLAWDCMRANGTVKIETNITGKIGDKKIDYLLHDFSGFYWYDSIRINGFFGYEKVSEYKTVNLEWGNPYHGKIQKVRDEAIQSYELKIRQDTIQPVHHGIMIIAMMADELMISDYNINNSDYNFKRFKVVGASGYEPTYFNDKGRRIAGVKVTFKRAVQSVIKTNC